MATWKKIAIASGSSGQYIKGDGSLETATFASSAHNHDASYSAIGHNHSGVYQDADTDLTVIAGLAGTTGFLTKTAANSWSLDTSAYSLTSHNHSGVYLTGNQSINLTGDATGSGATNIVVTLGNSGVALGTYKSVTVNAKGLVTGGTNPTTLAGYGITDAITSGGSATLSTVSITGDLTVGGTTTTINATNLEVSDKVVKLANTASPTNTTGSDSGILIETSTTDVSCPQLTWVNGGLVTGWKMRGAGASPDAADSYSIAGYTTSNLVKEGIIYWNSATSELFIGI